MLITHDVRVCESNEDTGRNAYRYKLPADASGARSSVVVGGGTRGKGDIKSAHFHCFVSVLNLSNKRIFGSGQHSITSVKNSPVHVFSTEKCRSALTPGTSNCVAVAGVVAGVVADFFFLKRSFNFGMMGASVSNTSKTVPCTCRLPIGAAKNLALRSAGRG